MRYRTQAVAYPYFVVALLLYGLQMIFGLLSAAKYLGPDPIKTWLPFDVAKAIHTNLLIVWVLAGFMGAAHWLVPEESRTELHSPRMAYAALALWTLAGVTAIVGYLFGWTAGNKFLEQPLPVKLTIVVVMLMFLYNLGMTIWKAKRLTTTEGILMAGLAMTAILYLPSLLEFDNYTVAIFYRWWTVHLWVEGVWEMIQGALLAYLLIQLSGIDREVMEKWLYVIVGLTFISGLLGTAHHYYYVGVPSYWLPLGGFFSALEPLVFVAMSAYAYQAIRRSGMSHPNTLALHWTLGSAIFSALGAGLLGLAHTWPSVNRWTHGTLITPMHGHSAFFGAYLDEIIEARSDTVVVIHPLTDDRRILPFEKTGELVEAAPGFQLVVSYNPGYQHGLKDLKPSTRQRFVALEFGCPAAEAEAEIVAHEGGIDRGLAVALVTLTNRLRQLGDRGLAEVPSTRLIIATARLVASGIGTRSACRAALLGPLTDDPDLLAAMHDLVTATM